MEKQIFKVGDKVFDIRFGWGEVIEIDDNSTYPVYVHFDMGIYNSYTNDGYFSKNDRCPMLSFTEYTLQGFSHERPINYEDYIGKWGIFWDNKDRYTIGKLGKFIKGENYPFQKKNGQYFMHFKPLPEDFEPFN